MAIFSEVVVKSTEGDTTKMFNLNCTSLYEIRTMLDIIAKEQLTEEFDKPTLCVAVNKEKLSLGAGPMLHILDLFPDIRCHGSFALGAIVCAVCYLVNGSLLVAVLADGSIIFINTLRDQPPRSRKLLQSCSPGATITEFMKEQSLLLVITEKNGSSNVIEIPDFERLIECDPRIMDEYLQDAINNAKYVSGVTMRSSLNTLISPSEIFSLSEFPGTSTSFSLGCDAFLESSDFMTTEYGYVCVREIGFYSVALTTHGHLHFFDHFTGQLFKDFDLRRDESFNDTFLSFEFLDAKEMEERFVNLKLLLAVDIGNGKYELQIRKFPENHIEYQVRTSKDVILLPSSTGDDNSIILVDPFNHKNPDSIQLRFINDTHPEIRFEKLIASGRFDEAEQFARMFNLDIMKVYLKRAIEMIGEFSDDDSDENMRITNKILEYCDKIKDDNAVGDICINAIHCLSTYQCIDKLLAYASRRRIDDVETRQALANRKYDLATFTAIADCENNFNATAWHALASDEDSVFNIFESAFALGEIVAARVFWARYSKKIQEYMEENQKLEELLDNLQSFVLDQPQYLQDIIEFVQNDFAPFYLMARNDHCEIVSRGNCLVNFILNVAIGLECVDPDNFPENAVFTCGLIEQTLETIRTEKTTPDYQNHFYNVLGYLSPCTTDATNCIGQLNSRYDNLKKMLRLKKEYQCRISYNQYVGHTVDSICFLILDRCKNIKTVRQHIQNVVMPYMKEHGLKKDPTLLEYIKKVSDLAVSSETTKQNNPWDDLCISFAENIENILFRCQAIIKIAKRSSIPWSDRLRHAVQEMFKAKGISTELRRDLNIQCRTEELGSIMIQYDISLSVLTKNFNQSNVMALLARAFYSSSKPITEKIEHLERMAYLFETITQNNMNVDDTVAQSIAIAANCYIKQGSSAPIKVVFSLMKSEKSRKIAAETLVEMSKIILEITSPATKEIREAAMDSCSIIARTYLPSTPCVTALLDAVNRLSRLQQQYGLLVPYSHLAFENTIAIESYLNSYMSSEPLKDFPDIVRMGKILGMKKERVCELALNHVSRNPQVLEASILNIAETSSTIDKTALNFAIEYIREMFYVIQHMASGSAFGSEEATYIIQFFRRLSPVISKLVEAALRLELPFAIELLFNIFEYLTLFENMMKCLSEMPDEIDRSFLNTITTEANEKEILSIFETTNRLGVITPPQVGMLYEGIEAVKVVSRVGYTLFMKTNTCDDTFLNVNLVDDSMLDRWEDVFTICGSNPYLILVAQSLAFKLPCLSHIEFDIKAVHGPVVDLCQKILVAENVDLRLAISVIFYLPDDLAAKSVKEIFNWAIQKQNSHVLFYISRIAQMVSFVNQDSHNNTSIFESYRGAWWNRRLMKEGLLISNVNKPKIVHNDFVNQLGSPTLYKEYCHAFKCDIDDMMLNYAFDLLRTSGNEKDSSRFERILEICASIFRMVEYEPKILCDRAFLIVDYLCPYNYKALGLVISYICQWAEAGNDEELKDKATDYRLLLQFLQTFERRNDFTLEETRWYLERQKKLNKQQLHRSSNVSDSMDFELETDHDLLNVNERQLLLEKNYPSSARKNFPFHVFLLQEKGDYEKNLEPMLASELDIVNVFGWLELRDQTTHVCSLMGRTVITTVAICNKVREVVSQQCDLNEQELITIKNLLMDMKVKLTVLKKLTLEINKLPLCMAKIKVLSLVRDVGSYWLQNASAPSNEKEDIFDFVWLITNILKQYECEFLLDEYSVVIVEKALLDDGTRLVQHIFSEFIDWNDRSDIQRKMTLAKKITHIHEITMNASLSEIVENWLEGGESMAGNLYTMTHLDSSDDLFPPLPYNDDDVVRMAYILSELNSREMYFRVAQILKSSNNESLASLFQRLRVLCVFIRCLKEEDFQAIFRCSIDSFAHQMGAIILNFALKVCQVDCDVMTYKRIPPEQFVMSLVNAQGGIRQTRETFQLAAVSIIDRRVTDSKLVEKTLKRLVQYKSNRYVKMLLQYSVNLPNFASLANLPAAYNIVCEAFWEVVEKNDKVMEHKFRDLIYFILSCPVESGASFKQLITNLLKQELQVGCRMVAAVSGFKASKFGSLIAQSSRDISSLDPEAMNKLGNMMTALHNGGEEAAEASFENEMFDASVEI